MEHSEGDAGPATTGLLRQIPAVNELLDRTALRDLQAHAGRDLVVECTRRVLQRLRDRIAEGSLASVSLEALEHLAEVSNCYSNLEYDLDRGARGKRDAHTDRLFCQLLGAEKTLLVNNNAAAVFLALNTLAEGAEVVV